MENIQQTIVFIVSIVLIVLVAFLVFKKQHQIMNSPNESINADKVKQLDKNGSVFKDIILDDHKIDTLMVTKKGIFVVQTKNYNGYIFGEDDDENWILKLKLPIEENGQKISKRSFLNPIKENEKRKESLLNLLGKDYPVFSVIVFSDKCELGDIGVYHRETYICNRFLLESIIDGINNSSVNTLDENDIDYISNKIENI